MLAKSSSCTRGASEEPSHRSEETDKACSHSRDGLSGAAASLK